MSTDKTFAQARGDLIADIEAVRLKQMPPETAAVIFDGWGKVNDSFRVEISLAKMAILAKQHGIDFAKSVRLGQRKINGEDT